MDAKDVNRAFRKTLVAVAQDKSPVRYVKIANLVRNIDQKRGQTMAKQPPFELACIVIFPA